MFTKNGKHFADWTDADGKRKRKSFTSKAKASAHEAAMKEQARPSKTRRQSPQSSRRSKDPSATAYIQTGQQSSASRRLVVNSIPANGGPVTLSRR